MLVKCIDNKGYEKIFTIGKIYSAQESDITGYLNVINDNGHTSKYMYIDRFEKIAQN